MNIYGLHYNFVPENEKSEGKTNFNSSLSVVLSSPEMSGQMCFFFWHNMYGSHVEYLNVHVAYGREQFGQLGELYFQKFGTQGPRWVETKMNVGYDHGDEPYKIRIEGLVDESYKGEMSIDDIRFEGGNCFEDADHPWEMCSFESTYEIYSCGYTSPESNEIEWLLRSGDEENENDHTLNTGKGHYMAMDLTSEMNHKKGLMVSPFYTPWEKDVYCMRFYWLARVEDHHSEDARINIRIYEGNSEEHSDFLITTVPIYHTVDNDQMWRLGESEIRTDQDFAMVFEMVAGNFNMSVGIDDITILPGHCTVSNCDFDYDMCFWYNLGDDDADWERNISEEGSFLYIDETAISDESKKYTSARIISQEFPNTMDGYDVCMTLKYRIFENTTERLSVILKADPYETTLWEINGNTEGKWAEAFVPISSPLNFYSVVVEADISNSGHGQISIDDIIFLPDSCQMKPENADPTLHASTHIQCPFDNDFCEYVQTTYPEDANVHFQIVEKRPTEANSGPDYGKGKFLFLDSLKYGNHSGGVILTSNSAAPSTQGYCLSFFYNTFGSDSSLLAIDI